MKLELPKEITRLPNRADELPVNKDHQDAGLVIYGQSMNETWLDLLRYLLIYGETAKPRRQLIVETRPAVIRLESPRKALLSVPDRFLNYSFMVAEWLWIVTGRHDVEMISYYNKQIAEFSDDGKTFFGAYGPRFIDQVDEMIALLRRDPDTRQAWIQVWRRPPAEGTKDVPCTLGWQFFIRDGRLELHAHMRSSDAWLGLPYDAFNFAMIQLGVAGALGLPVGPLTFMLGSSHLYQQHFEVAAALVNKYHFNKTPVPQGPFLPGLPGLCFREPIWTEQLARNHGELYRPATEPESHRIVWDSFREMLTYRHHRDASRLDGMFSHLMQTQDVMRFGGDKP
jgi:thymidylate synthase